jgi:hypothetical protein
MSIYDDYSNEGRQPPTGPQGQVIPATVAPQGTQGQARPPTATPATVPDEPSTPAEQPQPSASEIAGPNVAQNTEETGGQPTGDPLGFNPANPHSDGAGGYIPHQGPIPVGVAAAVKDPSTWDPFKDPAFMTQAAMAMADNNQGPEAYAWLAHVHQAVQENGVYAAQRLLANDPKGAVEAWNRNGQFKDAVSAQQHMGPDGKPDGTWDIARSNGQTVNVDPTREVQALLSPEAWVANEKGKAQIQMEQQHWAAQTAMWNDTGQARLMAAQARLESAQNSLTIAQQRGADARYIAEMNDRVKLLQTDLQTAQKREGMTVAQAKLQLAEDPRTAFQDTYRDAYKAGNGDVEAATTAAQRTLLMNRGRVMFQPNQDGRVAAFDRMTGQQIWTWKDRNEFVQRMGQEPEGLYDTSGGTAPTRAANPAQPGAQPTTDTPPPGYRKGTGSTPAATGLPAPSAASPTLASVVARPATPPQTPQQRAAAADAAEGGGTAASRLASSVSTQSPDVVRASFDADAKTMNKLQLFRKYGGLRSSLRPDQVQSFQ